MIAYKNTQSGWHFVVICILLTILVFAIVPLEQLGLLHYLMLFLLILLGVLFHSLTIEVDRGKIKCYFGQGLIGQEFPVREVAACESIRVSWFWGWGIRWTPKGWMYNIWGTRAVLLKFKSGKTFLMGSNEPDVVCDVIREEMAKR